MFSVYSVPFSSHACAGDAADVSIAEAITAANRCFFMGLIPPNNGEANIVHNTAQDVVEAAPGIKLIGEHVP